MWTLFCVEFDPEHINYGEAAKTYHLGVFNTEAEAKEEAERINSSKHPAYVRSFIRQITHTGMVHTFAWNSSTV